MNEEKIYGEEVVDENVADENVENEQVAIEEPVKAKKGFAKASLVLGILALVTTLFVINYVFGIISLVLGIIYLTKKPDEKLKRKAVAGIVCAAISLVISTTIWVSAYIYITKTNVTDIIEDVAGIMGQEINGEELVNQTISEMTGGVVDLATIEQFVGGEVSVERLMNFVGDVKEEDINKFVDKINTMDQNTMNAIFQDLGGEVTYEKLEEKLGKDFTLKEIMEYIDKFGA